MNVLVLGSGGREHALAWKIAQSKGLEELYCMPGNPGTAAIATNLQGSVGDFEKIKEAVSSHHIDMVVVGPENPLVDGITDYFKRELPDLMVIGPCAKGAQLEGSKDFAKEFMLRNNIPTARYNTFSAETQAEAFTFLESLKPPYVLKADGLAAGKGVIITESLEEAKSELSEMFHGKFGNAGVKVVIEEFLSGIELSVFVLTDGKDYLILPEAKDYKRIGEGDTGLNTGGMGSVSPVPFANAEFISKVENRIIKPTIAGLSKENIPYCGFIFIGLMNCGGDPYVIEYNVRMGDPETESVMTRIESDFLQHLVAAAKGELSGEKVVISDKTAVTVVCVSGGYPQDYEKGHIISGLNLCNGIVFHAGTKQQGDDIVTAGGRVLALVATGENLTQAQASAFDLASKIDYKGIYYRKDIAEDLKRYTTL